MKHELCFAVIVGCVGCCPIPKLTEEEYVRLAAVFEVAPIKNVGFGARTVNGWIFFEVDPRTRVAGQELQSLQDEISQRLDGFQDGLRWALEDPQGSQTGTFQGVPSSPRAQGHAAGARLARMGR